jgi:nitrogen fixation/metabolism regulation signal transduction histidine kinase
MSTSHPLLPPTQDSIDFEQAFKQFSLETQRLDMTYHSLEDKFHAVQQTLQESHTRISGKLAELDFISKYLESILEHISQGILFIDLHSIVTTYNASAQKILDIPEKNLLFHSFSNFFDDAFLGFSLKEALFTKKCPKNGFLSWKKGTEVIELEVETTFVSMSEQAYPLAHRGSSSQPIQGLLVLLRDVTRVRHLQQVANHHNRLKDLGELAAHLAHEIRNPLGGIKGFASLLEQELKERPDLHQMAAYIVQGSDDLNHFVTQVLQYARPYQLHIEKIDLIQLAEEIRQLMQVDANWSHQIEFVIQTPLKELFTMIDPFLFKSAILNLCVNAVQAMPHGGRLLISIIFLKYSLLFLPQKKKGMDWD